MINWLLMKKDKELETLSSELGFEKNFYLEDFIIIESENQKDLIKKVREAKKKHFQIIFQPKSEELLRFALEKVPIDFVLGVEEINPKDSVHFVRGALDQITCKIAKEKEKIFLISFANIINSKNQAKLLARIAFNLKLCRKYGVEVSLSNFSKNNEELRSKKDLVSFLRVLK